MGDRRQCRFSFPSPLAPEGEINSGVDSPSSPPSRWNISMIIVQPLPLWVSRRQRLASFFFLSVA